MHTIVSEHDVDLLLRALEKKSARGVRHAMWKYRARWNALSPAVKKALLTDASETQDAASASFFTVSSEATLLSVLTSAIPHSGACVLTGSPPGYLSVASKPLDAGASLTVAGPIGQRTMTKIGRGAYSALLGPAYQGPGLPAGTYTITGGGGPDIARFAVTLDAGNPVTWTNPPAAGSVIERSQPLVFLWGGGTLPGHVLIGGSQGGKETFLCSEDTATTKFTIPPVFLEALDPSQAVTLFIGQHPLEHQVPIAGLDVAWFVNAASVSVRVAVK